MKRKKILIKTIMILTLLFTSTGVNAIELTDIGGHWAENEISFMADKDFITGKPNGTFAPNDNVTRAEFATMIVRSGTFDRSRYRDQFSDVKKGSWYSDFVQTAYDKGWINGTPDGNFQPGKQISRTEMASILGRIVKTKSGYPAEGLLKVRGGFADSTVIPAWSHMDIAYAVEAEVMRGNTKNQFMPVGNATRAEAATAIKNALDFFGNVQ